jgi:MFS transporter, DHA2 family, methylenomycin A resistance protein
MATGLPALAALPAAAPAWSVIVLMIPVGSGAVLAVTALTTLLLENVPAERAGTASGVLNTSRQLGGTLAVALFGALVAGAPHFVAGLRTSLLIAAAAVAATVLATLCLRPVQRA